MDDELVRPTLERLRHGPIDPHVEVVSYDSDDRPVRSLASKALGTIERMARKGTISDQMADAAERFRSDFRTGALQTLRASAMREPIGSTRAPLLPQDIGYHASKARDRVFEVMGVIGPPGAACLWHVVGLEETIKTWASKHGRCSAESASGMLVAALGTLATYYGL